VVAEYTDTYLRAPTAEDVARHAAANAKRGMPGMFGSNDCMHWGWANCPKAHHGQFKEGTKKPTVVLEAACTGDLWIWHAFFGLPGALNDINVLQFVDKVLSRSFRMPDTCIGDVVIDSAYFLCDGILFLWYILAIIHFN